MKNIIIIFAALALLSLRNQAQTTVTDADGNIYDTVHIGTQVWLQQNLATTKYNDGSQIPLVTDTSWQSLKTPAYCWYDNDSATYKNPYGTLYNFYTVNTGKLCPTGWHVPTNEEFHMLVKVFDASAQLCYCTESTTAANALKDTGTTFWDSPNTGTNLSRFTALGGGSNSYESSGFSGLNVAGYYWTSTSGGPGYPTYYYRSFYNNSSLVYEYLDWPTQGYSVRCIQDTVTTTGGLKSINNSNWLTIFPNPATSSITIENTRHLNAEIEISDIQGQLIKTLSTIYNKTHIDVSTFPCGLYIVKMITEKGISVNKFIKD